MGGQASQSGGFGDGQFDGCDVGWAGFSAVVGHGRVTQRDIQIRVAGGVLVGRGRGHDGVFGVGQVDGAGQGRLDRGGAQVGEGGQGGVPADPGEVAGLGLVPAQDVLACLKGFLYWPAASGDVMKYVMVAGRSGGAQHR